MKEDIATTRQALKAAKTNAFLHRRGGLHNLWAQLVAAIAALDRIEKTVTTTQMPMLLLPDTADYKRET